MIKIRNVSQPVLITGATGFVGANLVRFFISKGLKVNIIIRKNSNIWRIKDIIRKTNVFYADLRDRKKLRKIVKKIKPKSIFHFATYGAYSSQNDLKLIKSTILNGTINLLNECKKFKFNIFLNSGSSSEYGFKKNKMSENSLLKPNSHYAVFKSAVTLLCHYEAVTNKLPIITVRPFHVYGQFEEPSRLIPTVNNNEESSISDISSVCIQSDVSSVGECDVDDDELQEFYQSKKYLWQEFGTPVIAQKQFKINIENDKIEAYTMIKCRPEDKDQVKTSIKTIQLEG